MSVNKYQPHILLLPEDDANSEIANGFVLEVRHVRKIQILPEAGGWTNARDRFFSEHEKGMRKYPERHFVLLIDFDDDLDRADTIKQKIPEDLKDRVFVIGAKSEPEELTQAGLGSLENIGRGLAIECRNGSRDLWCHDLLKHNTSEIDRMNGAICGLLFQ